MPQTVLLSVADAQISCLLEYRNSLLIDYAHGDFHYKPSAPDWKPTRTKTVLGSGVFFLAMVRSCVIVCNSQAQMSSIFHFFYVIQVDT